MEVNQLFSELTVLPFLLVGWSWVGVCLPSVFMVIRDAGFYLVKNEPNHTCEFVGVCQK